MSYVAIPVAALESQGYLALTRSTRSLFFDLYIAFHDCECFTIERDGPDLKRQPDGPALSRKVAELIDAGLIRVVRRANAKTGRRRVYAFTHSALMPEQTEATGTLRVSECNAETREDLRAVLARAGYA